MKIATAYDPGALFQPDIIVGAQGQRRRPMPCSGERALMGAMLEGAYDDLVKHRAHWNGCRPAKQWGPKGSPNRFMPARDYILSTDRDWSHSFENCCEHLGLNPGCVRRELTAKGLL